MSLQHTPPQPNPSTWRRRSSTASCGGYRKSLDQTERPAISFTGICRSSRGIAPRDGSEQRRRWTYARPATAITLFNLMEPGRGAAFYPRHTRPGRTRRQARPRISLSSGRKPTLKHADMQTCANLPHTLTAAHTPVLVGTTPRQRPWIAIARDVAAQIITGRERFRMLEVSL